MSAMPPHFHHHNSAVNDQYKIPRPKSLSEVPSFVKRLIGSFSKRMFYIAKLVWEANPAMLYVMCFMAIFNGVMPVIGAVIAKDILNILAKAYNHEITAFKIVVTLLVIQFLYMFFDTVVNRFGNMITRISGEMVENHIKIKIMTKSKEIDLASFDNPDFYSKMENASREAGRRPIQALDATFSIASSVISIVSFIIIIATINIVPALLIILVAVPSTIINFIYRKKHFTYLFSRSTARRQLNYYAGVVVNKDLVKEVQMMGLTDLFVDKYNAVFKTYFAGLKKLIINECFWNVGAALLSTLVNCILFIWIAKGVFNGVYEVGNYALYTGALNAIAAGIAKLITTTAMIYESTLFINNMIAFMEEKRTIIPSINPPRSVQRTSAHEIEFRDVTFRYPGTQKKVLSHLNLTIAAGESMVIVGLNGAGKTTLIKLMTRLYDPTEGTILLDGHDIREYDISELYSLFGLVFQDFGKYAVSVKDNIAFGEILRDVTQDAVKDAAQMSNSDDFINALPKQYDTMLMRYFDDNGVELSIGQWQKLSIARAFYSNSDILILDEPTASLDPLAEQEIFNHFDSLRVGKTSVFVSHRLSSAVTANKIVVLKYGKILESGTHQQLMEAQGEYHNLFSTQAKRYIS